MSSTSTAQRSSLARLPAMFLVALVPVVLLEIAVSVACKRRLPADDVVALAPVVLLASPVAAALVGARVFRPKSVSGLALALTAATVLFLAFAVTAALHVDSLLEFESGMLVSVGAACGFVVGRWAWWVITSLRSRPVWWKLPGIGAAAGGGAAIVGLIWLSESWPHLCCGDELLKGVPASWASACGVVLVLGLMPSGGPREETLPAEDMRRRIGKWLRIGAFALALAAMAASGFYAGERWGRGKVVERPDLAARPDSAGIVLDFMDGIGFGRASGYKLIIRYPGGAGQSSALWQFVWPATKDDLRGKLSGPTAAQGTLTRVEFSRLWAELARLGIWTLPTPGPCRRNHAMITPGFVYELSVSAERGGVHLERDLHVDPSWVEDERYYQLLEVIQRAIPMEAPPWGEEGARGGVSESSLRD